MQKRVKIFFDVIDDKYKETFYSICEKEREIEILISAKSIINDFILDWKTVFEKYYDIPSRVIKAKYVDKFKNMQ